MCRRRCPGSAACRQRAEGAHRADSGRGVRNRHRARARGGGRRRGPYPYKIFNDMLVFMQPSLENSEFKNEIKRRLARILLIPTTIARRPQLLRKSLLRAPCHFNGATGASGRRCPRRCRMISATTRDRLRRAQKRLTSSAWTCAKY
ncbi:PP263 [Orf virus]|uniref:PP263 n=1 Tax=Orf virus TaxID=10258 RepID=F1AXG0_ORFV|nr:PP263 [Orf virus]